MKREKHAMIMLNSVRGTVYVMESEFEKATEILDAAELKVRAMYNLDKLVYSFFFKAKTVFYLKKANFEQYYKSSLQFLAYTDQKVNSIFTPLSLLPWSKERRSALTWLYLSLSPPRSSTSANL